MTTQKILPSTFAEATYQLDGQPFRLTNRHYLKPIYDSNIEEGIIMSGRQVEKSTTNSTSLANCTLLMPNFKGLYFAPLNSQVKEFSNERLGKLYQYSQDDVIQKELIDKHDTQAVFMKTIKKTNATVYLKHCYGLGDNIRGITVNGIWGDEIQDIHIDAIPVIKECQSHASEAGSRNKITWYTGTPKTFSNTIQQYWDKSTQNEWVVKCPRCNQYQIMGVKNLSPNAFLCRKCRREIPKQAIIDGFWLEMQSAKKLKGFRISQLMVPWISAQDIWNKYENYSPDKFYNEVLGRSYENASKPFTPLMLGQISANDLRLYNRADGEFANKPTYMGVDWGTGEKSFTVVKIYGYNNQNKFQLLYVKRYAVGDELDPEYQIRDICNLISIFRVAKAVVDWGFGYDRYKKLQSIFGEGLVVACYYSFNQKQKKKYDADQARWIVNRTQVMQDYITDVQQQRVVWPGASKAEFPWLYDHHLAELAEYRKSQSGRSEDLLYTHPEGQPDDGVHAGVYAKLAAEIHRETGDGAFQFSGFHDNSGW
ncbi:MAG: phage terminase large subunit family protein [Paraclostridium sp.]